jgi:hypothetical protein
MVDVLFARLWEATVFVFKAFGFLFKGIIALIRTILNNKKA